MQPQNQSENSGWTFRQEGGTPEQPQGQNANYAEAPQPVNDQPVTWTASEFIAHHKDARWYAGVIAGIAALCVITLLATRDLISVIAITIVAVLFLVLSNNKPRQQVFQIDNRGISIGQKFYPYEMFKSFAMTYEGAIGSVSFMPLKRLMPEISIYFAPEDEERIVDVLLSNLPNDQRGERGSDRLLKRLRF